MLDKFLIVQKGLSEPLSIEEYQKIWILFSQSDHKELLQLIESIDIYQLYNHINWQNDKIVELIENITRVLISLSLKFKCKTIEDLKIIFQTNNFNLIKIFLSELINQFKNEETGRISTQFSTEILESIIDLLFSKDLSLGNYASNFIKTYQQHSTSVSRNIFDDESLKSRILRHLNSYDKRNESLRFYELIIELCVAENNYDQMFRVISESGPYFELFLRRLNASLGASLSDTFETANQMQTNAHESRNDDDEADPLDQLNLVQCLSTLIGNKAAFDWLHSGRHLVRVYAVLTRAAASIAQRQPVDPIDDLVLPKFLELFAHIFALYPEIAFQEYCSFTQILSSHLLLSPHRNDATQQQLNCANLVRLIHSHSATSRSFLWQNAAASLVRASITAIGQLLRNSNPDVQCEALRIWRAFITPTRLALHLAKQQRHDEKEKKEKDSKQPIKAVTSEKSGTANEEAALCIHLMRLNDENQDGALERHNFAGVDPNNDETAVMRSLFTKIKNPITPLRLAALELLAMLANQRWSHELFAGCVGLIELLLDRRSEMDKLCVEERHRIISNLVESSESAASNPCFAAPIWMQLRKYRQEGAFFIIAQSCVASAPQ